MAFLSLLVNTAGVERGASGFRLMAGQLGAAVLSQTVGTPAGTLLVERVKAAAPVRSGKLRDSIALRRTATGLQIVAVGYSQFVIGGTRPHTIAPRNKRVLRFTASGGIVYASLVHHPGTKPNDFPRKALDQATPGLRLLLGAEGQRLIRLAAL